MKTEPEEVDINKTSKRILRELALAGAVGKRYTVQANGSVSNAIHVMAGLGYVEYDVITKAGDKWGYTVWITNTGRLAL
jgi:hypothetical protein